MDHYRSSTSKRQHTLLVPDFSEPAGFRRLTHAIKSIQVMARRIFNETTLDGRTTLKHRLQSTPRVIHINCSKLALSITKNLGENMAQQIVVARIELRGIMPKIWRRVALSTKTDLVTFHQIIQNVFGWGHRHLWEFSVRDEVYGVKMPEFQEHHYVHDAAGFMLEDFLIIGVKRMTYTYDLGDDWRHQITFGVLRDPKPGVRYPQLIAGARNCPPEDIGGAGGYYDFLDERSRENDRYPEWLGDYDPDEFDIDKACSSLGRCF